MLNRMVRAGRLDVDAYEEAKERPLSARQAMSTVAISSVAAGIGTVGQGGLVGVALGTVAALLGWLMWSLISYLLGIALSHTTFSQTSYWRLFRTIGYSSSPGVIRILGVIPFLYAFINLAAQVWMLAAMVSAARQVLDFDSTWRAVGVVGVGWMIQVVFLVVFFLLVI